MRLLLRHRTFPHPNIALWYPKGLFEALLTMGNRMRLVCPNCGAQYEVSKDVIPDVGRDVQCSNCGHTWFQPHPDFDPDLADELGKVLPTPRPQQNVDVYDDDDDGVPVPPPSVAPPRQRKLDPEIADVLRQEAEIEARARAAERQSLESQPDLGLEAPAARSRPPKQTVIEDPAPEREDRQKAKGKSRGNMLPDIDEINSTLRSATERRAIEAEHRDDFDFDEPDRDGFLIGLRVAIIAVVVLIGLYVFAPMLGEAVPQLNVVLEPFVATVDSARVWLSDMVDKGLMMLDGLSSESAEQN